MIKNIIFDLGGVILDVDYHKTVEAFKQLGIDDFHTLYSQQKQDLLFDRFEKGEISATEFREVIKKMNRSLSDESINNAWNAMILDTPKVRMQFLEQLKKNYRLFLLSNTNEIHIKAFTNYFDKNYGVGYFPTLFEKVYLSSQLGMRKPEPTIFELVIRENSLNKTETLFIDDSPQHIAGAVLVGIKALLLPKGEKMELFLPEQLINN